MLQLTNGNIVEFTIPDVTYTGGTGTFLNADNCSVPFEVGKYEFWPNATQTIHWNSYPVYVCSDKTKKAIEILKALQAEKQIECKSVPRFIELVEKIASIL